jgi:hypothetical protein
MYSLLAATATHMIHCMHLTFQFLGRLAARCLMDGQVLPLPLSTDFTRLILACATAATTTSTSTAATAASTTATSTANTANDSVSAAKASYLFSVADLPRLYLQPGAIVQRLHRALASTTTATSTTASVATASTGSATGAAAAAASDVDATAVLVDGIRLDTWLDAVCLSLVDPLTGERLEPDGVNGPGLRGTCQTAFANGFCNVSYSNNSLLLALLLSWLQHCVRLSSALMS